jgi:hypothetical protein
MAICHSREEGEPVRIAVPSDYIHAVAKAPEEAVLPNTTKLYWTSDLDPIIKPALPGGIQRANALASMQPIPGWVFPMALGVPMIAAHVSNDDYPNLVDAVCGICLDNINDNFVVRQASRCGVERFAVRDGT